MCTCVRLQELFSCDTEVGHQQMSPGLKWKGLLGLQLSSQFLTPLNPLCNRPQQVIIETQRPCAGWLSLIVMDWTGQSHFRSSLSEVSEPRHMWSRVHSVSVLCCSRSPSHQDTESKGLSCPRGLWRGVLAGSNLRSSFRPRSSALPASACQGPQNAPPGPRDPVNTRPGLGQAL